MPGVIKISMIIAIREDQSVRGDTVAESVESKSSELRRASAGKAKVRNSATPDVEAAVPDSQVEDVSSHKGSQRPEHAAPRHLASAVNRDRWKNSHPAPNEEVIPTIELDSSDNAFQSVPQSSTSSVDYQLKLVTSLRSIEPHVLDFRTMANLNIFHLQLEFGEMQKEVSDLEENSITPSALDMKRLEDNLHRYSKTWSHNRSSKVTNHQSFSHRNSRL